MSGGQTRPDLARELTTAALGHSGIARDVRADQLFRPAQSVGGGAAVEHRSAHGRADARHPVQRVQLVVRGAADPIGRVARPGRGEVGRPRRYPAVGHCVRHHRDGWRVCRNFHRADAAGRGGGAEFSAQFEGDRAVVPAQRAQHRHLDVRWHGEVFPGGRGAAGRDHHGDVRLARRVLDDLDPELPVPRRVLVALSRPQRRCAPGSGGACLHSRRRRGARGTRRRQHAPACSATCCAAGRCGA